MSQTPFFFLNQSVEKRAAGLGSLRNPLIGAGLGAGAGGLLHAYRRAQMDEEEKERAGSGTGSLLASVLGGGALGAGAGAATNLLGGRGDGIRKGDYWPATPYPDMPEGLQGESLIPKRPPSTANALDEMTQITPYPGMPEGLQGRSGISALQAAMKPTPAGAPTPLEVSIGTDGTNTVPPPSVSPEAAPMSVVDEGLGPEANATVTPEQIKEMNQISSDRTDRQRFAEEEAELDKAFKLYERQQRNKQRIDRVRRNVDFDIEANTNGRGLLSGDMPAGLLAPEGGRGYDGPATPYPDMPEGLQGESPAPDISELLPNISQLFPGMSGRGVGDGNQLDPQRRMELLQQLMGSAEGPR